MVSTDQDVFARRTGIILAIIFFIASVVSFYGDIVDHYPDIGAALWHIGYLLTLIMAAVMLATAFYQKLVFLQPLVFLIGASIGLLQSSDSFYGLGFYSIAIIVLFRMGFYERRRAFRVFMTLLLLYLLIIISTFLNNENFNQAIESIFFITVFLLMLYLAFEEKLLVYLKEPREELSLSEAKLSETEKRYVLECVGGKQPKAIAADHKLSESTVRNTLANAYKKLKINDRSELMALAAKYDIVA